jgi:hypothetical protein
MSNEIQQREDLCPECVQVCNALLRIGTLDLEPTYKTILDNAAIHNGTPHAELFKHPAYFMNLFLRGRDDLVDALRKANNAIYAHSFINKEIGK